MENHRILIVEDDEAIAGAVSRIIESWGFTPRCVRDFRDVLREFTDFDPHLVLMDITLPFFNGYHWCSEIRKISAVPIIFVSSASENMNIVMAVDMAAMILSQSRSTPPCLWQKFAPFCAVPTTSATVCRSLSVAARS